MNYRKLAIHTVLGAALVAAATTNVDAQVFYESPVVVQGGLVQQGTIVQEVQTFQEPTEEQLKQLRIGANLYDSGSSPVVRSVFTNGPAQKAGLQSGDIITKVNGEDSSTVSNFNSKLAQMSAGDTFKLTRSRGGEETELTVSVMTLADVLKASSVPEPGMFDSAIGQSKTRIASLKQQIENAKLDMADLEKRLAAEEEALAKLNKKAEAAEMETKKMETKKAEKMAAEKAEKMAAEKAEKMAAEKAKKMESEGKEIEGSMKKN